MRRWAEAPGVLAAVCLLSVQFSGLHMHVDQRGYVGVPETSASHSHHHGHRHHDDSYAGSAASPDRERGGDEIPGNDYEGARDSSLLDSAVGAFKLPPVVLILVFLFVLLPGAFTLASTDVVYPVLSGRFTRWRPPLRAPPRIA